MTNLSRLAKIGMAVEGTPGTYTAPTFSVPFHTASYESIQEPLRDESVRANDAVLQGLYAGPAHSTFNLDLHSYSDIIGNWFRFVGPDTVTAATSTTLSSSAAAGATTITTAATIPAGSTIRIDTSTNTEYAVTGSPSGGGPYTIPIANPSAGLALAHSSGVAVTTQTTHTFQQSTSTRPPSYSITVFDTVETLGFAGAKISELAIKIDPKAIVTVSPKFMALYEVSQSPFTPSYTTQDPMLGWQWALTTASGASTRGLTYDMTLKRATEVIFSSDGTFQPREIFNGALEMDGTFKAIHENTTDMDEFRNYKQRTFTSTITQLPQLNGHQIGGTSLAITTSVTGMHKAVRDHGQPFMQATYSMSGINNATDGGVVKIVLKNFTTSQY